MSNYGVFAKYYDSLTFDVNYEVRSDYISDFFIANNKNCKTILDLACGTCSISQHLMKKGYSIIGLDLSQDMLSEAYNKLLEVGDEFSLIQGNMTDFALSKKVDACVCSLDSINHLDSVESVKNTFKCVYEALNDNGVFVFDVNTIYKHQNILGENTFVFDEEDLFLSWDNELLDDTTVRILLDFFVFNGTNYDRFSEEIIEKAYDLDALSNLLEKLGFVDIKVYDELTLEDPKEDSQRVYFVCRKGSNG